MTIPPKNIFPRARETCLKEFLQAVIPKTPKKSCALENPCRQAGFFKKIHAPKILPPPVISNGSSPKTKMWINLLPRVLSYQSERTWE